MCILENECWPDKFFCRCLCVVRDLHRVLHVPHDDVLDAEGLVVPSIQRTLY
jgi:hypothetical protein